MVVHFSGDHAISCALPDIKARGWTASTDLVAHEFCTCAAGKPKTQRKKGKAVTQDVEEDGSAEDSADEDDAESDTTSADDGDDSQEHSDGSLDGATTKPKSAGAFVSNDTA